MQFNDKTRTIVLIVVGVAIIGVIGYLESQKTSTDGSTEGSSLDAIISNESSAEEKAGKYDTAKEITTPDGFINTDSITIEELIGKKVILVDFWTYSCINCQRTTPYLNAWYDKYADEGLEIIGIHTPEFEFEKKIDNVQEAVDTFNIEYPVVLDNDFSTWRAYKNRYWPRKYLIDIDGYIVYDHIGEGSYDETERVIQQLLEERSERLAQETSFSRDIVQPEGAETIAAQSPEIYFGAMRNDLLGNGPQGEEGVFDFTLPKDLKGNTLYLAGTWDVEPEYAQNITGNDAIVFAYNAKKVHMVASGVGPVEAEVYIDGELVTTLAGKDVDGRGIVTIENEQLYNLIDDPNGPAVHVLEIRPLKPGLQVYTFTFG